MTIEELFALTEWVSREIQGRNVIQKFDALITVLKTNSRPNQEKQPFDEQKSDLLDTLLKINTNSLSYDQQRILEKLGIFENVTHSAVSKIEDVLFRNALDVATAHKTISNLKDRVNKGLQAMSKINESLLPIIDELPDIESSGAILKVHFAGDAGIGNVTNLKHWSSEWHEIARGFAMAHGGAPEDARVLGAHYGSLVIVFGVGLGIATSISATILGLLKIVEQGLNIRKQVEEIRNLKLNNKKIEEDLQNEADTQREKGIEELISEIIESLPKQPDGEVKTALSRGIRKLSEFVDAGGSVDCYLPKAQDDEDEEQPEQISELRSKLTDNFEKVRELENRILALEHSSISPEPNA